MTGTGIYWRGKRVVGSATVAALLALAYSIVSSGASAAEAPDTVGSWPADCEGALVRGQAPTLIWADEIQVHGRDKLSSYINHPAFGLQIPEYWKTDEFRALPYAERMAEYETYWSGVFIGSRGEDSASRKPEIVTHYVTMPKGDTGQPEGFTFERVVFDHGTGAMIKLPSGETIRDPGFGALGVAWRVRDPKTGSSKGSLLWSAPLPNRYTWDKAKELCAQWGGRLPTIEEYGELVDALGQYIDNKDEVRLQELMGFENAYYWSSSQGFVALGYVLRLNGGSGHAATVDRHDSNGAVRCVR